MNCYRFRLIDGEGVREVEFEHKDDIEAFKTAEALARHFDVELLQGRKFLALVRKNGHMATAGPHAIDAGRRPRSARPPRPETPG